MVVNGYAGTGKTTAISAVIGPLKDLGCKCVLMAPTGRAAKVLSGYAGQPAYTIHKHIYRQKSVGGDGYGQFSLAPNKDKDTIYVVDEVSLIATDIVQSQSTGFFGSGAPIPTPAHPALPACCGPSWDAAIFRFGPLYAALW